jgi:hypothetical protein
MWKRELQSYLIMAQRDAKSAKEHLSTRIELEVEIPGIRPESRISDLTVEQFVQLLVQVSGQLRAHARARATDPDVIETIANTIQDKLKGKPLKRQDAVGNRVLKTQLAILEKMPAAMKAYTESLPRRKK